MINTLSLDMLITNILFAGTTEFSLIILQALAKKNYNIYVLTKKDQIAKRGKKIQINPVKQFALANNLDLYQSDNLNDDKLFNDFNNIKLDLAIVVDFGLMFPVKLLNIPKYNCINIHASLLPKFRGASPVQSVILAGETYSGISIIEMNEKLDAGDILFESKIKLKQETGSILRNKLAILGAESIIKLLKLDNWQKITQNHKLASYSKKITKQQCFINWKDSAEFNEKKIRAYNSLPSAKIRLNEQTQIKVFVANIIKNKSFGDLGEIIATTKNSFIVQCGENSALEITHIQLPGKKPMLVSLVFAGNKNIFKRGVKFL